MKTTVVWVSITAVVVGIGIFPLTSNLIVRSYVEEVFRNSDCHRIWKVTRNFSNYGLLNDHLLSFTVTNESTLCSSTEASSDCLTFNVYYEEAFEHLPVVTNVAQANYVAHKDEQSLDPAWLISSVHTTCLRLAAFHFLCVDTEAKMSFTERSIAGDSPACVVHDEVGVSCPWPLEWACRAELTTQRSKVMARLERMARNMPPST